LVVAPAVVVNRYRRMRVVFCVAFIHNKAILFMFL
jgi:hypothetical protein